MISVKTGKQFDSQKIEVKCPHFSSHPLNSSCGLSHIFASKYFFVVVFFLSS